MVTPKIEREAEARNYGKFVISPLEHGYGITLGNALRRVLLSSLDGVAVTSIRIADVQHEFSEIPGVREDVIRGHAGDERSPSPQRSPPAQRQLRRVAASFPQFRTCLLLPSTLGCGSKLRQTRFHVDQDLETVEIGPHERLLSVREVAASLGVCASTVYKLCDQGKLAHVRVANAIRVLPVEVERLNRGERKPLDPITVWIW